MYIMDAETEARIMADFLADVSAETQRYNEQQREEDEKLWLAIKLAVQSEYPDASVEEIEQITENRWLSELGLAY